MKTPILAMLLAGATAQKRPQMDQDRAVPLSPVKPGDLDGCTNDAVSQAKGVHLSAVQAVTGFEDGLKPLETAVSEKMKLKTTAINNVIAKDKLDKDAIQADYSAAAAEIASRADFVAKTTAYNLAKVAYDAYNGEVQVDSGVADDASTKDKDESLKQIALVKAKGGAVKLATDASNAAKDKQKKISDALLDANNNKEHWKKEIDAEKLKDMAGPVAAALLNQQSTAKTVKDLNDDYTAKNKTYTDAKAVYDGLKAKYDKIKAVYDAVAKKITDSVSAPGDNATFKAEQDTLISEGKKVKEAYAKFLTELQKKQGSVAATDYKKLVTGENCKTAVVHAGDSSVVAGQGTADACAAECTKLKYVTYLEKYDGTKKDYKTEFMKWYDKTTNNGVDLKIVDDNAGKTGCTAFSWKSGVCKLWDKAVAIATADTSFPTGNCYTREALNIALTPSTGTNALWKLYYDRVITEYKAAKAAFTSKINTNWSTYEQKGVAERARVDDVALWEKEKAKAKKVMDDYDTNTVAPKKLLMDNAKSPRDTAYGKITDIAYYQAVNAAAAKQAIYDAAVAAKKVVDDKIARIGKIQDHMDKSGVGQIKDLTDAKAAQDQVVIDTGKALDAANLQQKGFKDDMDAKLKLVAAAKLDWDGKKATAATKIGDVKAQLDAVAALRGKVDTEVKAVKEAIAARAAQEKKIADAKKERDAKLALWNKEVEKCKGLKYDKFVTDVETKKSERNASIKAIEKLIDNRKTYAHGVINGRCEKPQSNGDRIKRGKCASETACCGAATGYPMGSTGPLVTIEVCQEKTATQWGYVAPRAPLAEVDATPVNWPFKCIDGASKLAGAAAVLASAYMMA